MRSDRVIVTIKRRTLRVFWRTMTTFDHSRRYAESCWRNGKPYACGGRVFKAVW